MLKIVHNGSELLYYTDILEGIEPLEIVLNEGEYAKELDIPSADLGKLVFNGETVTISDTGE